MRKPILFAASAALLALSFRPAGAQGLLASAPDPLRVGFGAGGGEWSLVVNRGKPDIRLTSEGGAEILELRSSRSSFGLQRKVEVDLSRRPILAWRWRAEVLPEGGDFRAQGTNDQAGQLYVAFSRTRAIGYIWDTSAPEGAVGDSPSVPPFIKVRIVVLRSGPGGLGSWVAERRDLRADYERLFGEPMPETRSLGLRLWINSQHTGTNAAYAISDIRLE
jgi:hypothetical protein